MPDKSDFLYKTHTELLQNETFFIWKLSPTAQMDEYWMNLQQKYSTTVRFNFPKVVGRNNRTVYLNYYCH